MSVNENTITVAGFALIAAVVTAVVAYFGGRNSAIAQLQASINAGFETLNRANGKKITQLEGEIRQLKQYNNSLSQALRSSGIDLPPQHEVTVVFAPFPENQ